MPGARLSTTPVIACICAQCSVALAPPLGISLASSPPLLIRSAPPKKRPSMDPGNASAYARRQMVRWWMRPWLATCAEKVLAIWRKSAAVTEETPVYMLSKESDWAAHWRMVKHVSGHCACSCADANGALGGEFSFVAGQPPVDETSLVGGPSSAATDAFMNAVMDKMKKISKKCMESLARVAFCMDANEGLGKQMQRAKKESDVQADAVRKEHAKCRNR